MVNDNFFISYHVIIPSNFQGGCLYSTRMTFMSFVPEIMKFTMKYHKILKISPGAYIFQRPFLRGLYSEGLIYGAMEENLHFESIGLAL